jgi:hypothetical protein
MSIEDKNNNDNKSLTTYLPYSEHCLAPKFLANDRAVNTFIRLVKESHETHQQTPHLLSAFECYKKPFSELFSSMSGLTEDQRLKAITAAHDLEKQPARKKLEPQF